MRQFLVLLVAAASVVGACGSTDRPPIERVSGNIGASDGAASGTGATGAADGQGTTGGQGMTGPGIATGSIAAGGSAGTAAGTGGGDGSGSSAGSAGSVAGSSGDAADRGQMATAALDAYLDALQAEDFAGAQRASTGGPAFMARVRDVVSRYNKERDGVTTLSYSARSFQVASNEATKVSFTGQARLEATTSGPAGDPQKESALFESPVVSFSNRSWRVGDLRYNGQPLRYFPATSHTSLGGVDLRLPGALSFGTSTGLIVDLVSDGDHSIKIDKAKLHYADGSSASPKLGALISKKPAALYFLFDRSASAPTRWTATVTIDGGTSREARADVVLRF